MDVAWRSWRVGERVVVRYRLPDPASASPALTDALGEVVATGEDGLTIRTRRGDVTVPAGAIVLGKRVPPPPPPRRSSATEV